jgi:hypothetical protein
MYIIYHDENVEFPHGTYWVPLVEVIAKNDITKEATLYSTTRLGIFTLFSIEPSVLIVDDTIEIKTEYFIGIKDRYYIQEGETIGFNISIPYPIETEY